SARAREAFERALDLEIRGREAWYALGSLLFLADGERRQSSTRSDAFAEIEQALANDQLAAAEALSHTLLKAQPESPIALRLRAGHDAPLLRGAKALALALDGHYSRAIEVFDSFIGTCNSSPGLWHEYAKVLRWAGEQRMGIAFRRSTEILPSYFAAYYALATVKSF